MCDCIEVFKRFDLSKKTRATKGSGKGKNARLGFLVVHPAQTLAKMAGGRSHIPGAPEPTAY